MALFEYMNKLEANDDFNLLRKFVHGLIQEYDGVLKFPNGMNIILLFSITLGDP